MKNEKIRKITGIAIFICLVVVLQLFSNYVTFGPVSITLALIPIVVGSIIYGPMAGFILGAVCGITISLAQEQLPYSGHMELWKHLSYVYLKQV